MNTRIVRRLNLARCTANREKELKSVAEEIVLGHNIAVTNGFLELPVLDYIDAEQGGEEERTMSVIVAPKSGMISLNDLYNLKTAWGADEVNVLTATQSVELVFKK